MQEEKEEILMYYMVLSFAGDPKCIRFNLYHQTMGNFRKACLITQ